MTLLCRCGSTSEQPVLDLPCARRKARAKHPDKALPGFRTVPEEAHSSTPFRG
jgi:hypothetical protein